MRYCRFQFEDRPHWGRLEADAIHTLTDAPWRGGQPTGESHSREVRLLAPTVPSKIVCVGRNYAEHAAELGNKPPERPLIFLKPPSSVIGTGDDIVYPRLSERVDYEGELALVIGRRTRGFRRGTPLGEAVFGFTCLNDVTARDLQKSDGQFTRGKGFDTFCAVGPVVATELDPANLIVESYLNGERRQSAPVTEMLFPLDVIIEFISAVMTLEPGDLIATGTPAGVGPMQPGDTVEVNIEGIGRLRNSVVAEP